MRRQIYLFCHVLLLLRDGELIFGVVTDLDTDFAVVDGRITIPRHGAGVIVANVS